MAPRCRFIETPSGCRFKQNCKFSHDLTSPSSPISALNNTSDASPGPSGQRRGDTSSGSTAKAPPGICNFYWSSGRCRHEQACRFRHVTQGDQPTSPVPGNNPPTNDSTPSASKAPPGVCNFYWAKGRCIREFDCRFKHIAEAEGTLGTSPSVKPESNNATTPAFLTDNGLQRFSSSGADMFFSSPAAPRSPTETHNSLKRYLADHFRFNKVFDVYAFVTLLGNVNASNGSWTPEDCELLLEVIGSGNGLLRIGDVLRWVPVSSAPKTGDLSFQRGLVPLLRFLSSGVVVKSALHHRVNALFNAVIQNLEDVSRNLALCMTRIIQTGTFRESNGGSTEPHLGIQLFAALMTIFYECLTRFKNVAATNQTILPLIRQLQSWFEAWDQGIISGNPSFDNPFGENLAARDHILRHLGTDMERIMSIVERESRRNDTLLVPSTKSGLHRRVDNAALAAALHMTFQGPGQHRSEGPRHDNDAASIADIRIAPTHDELISPIPPFLPANLYDAPHHCDLQSLERVLDIQFRLLREELTAPVRSAVQSVRDDLLRGGNRTLLAPILKSKGGKYRSEADGDQESVFANIYTGVQFAPLTPDRRGLAVGLTMDTPPGRARGPANNSRATFWESMGGKRLMQGGLVALIWKEGQNVSIYLGLISSPTKELVASARASPDRISLKVAFFDSVVDLKILHALKEDASSTTDIRILVEAPVMYESIRPFLEALQVVPEALPFSRYLVHRPPEEFQTITISPPKYAAVRGFTFQLGCLFPPGAGVANLSLSVNDPTSVTLAREELDRASRLDTSQANAVVDALTREVSLIQGPPGTGKSYTGVELLRVLISNGVKPIVMIAFTNHALDHMLCSVLDAGITSHIVRLGSRSSDERISKYSIENLEMAAAQSRMNRSFARNHRELKGLEEDIVKLMKDYMRAEVPPKEIMRQLETDYPEQYYYLNDPPDWVKHVWTTKRADEMGWQTAGRQNKQQPWTQDDTSYSFWLQGGDLKFLLSLSPSQRPSQLPEDVGPVETSNRFTPLMDTGFDAGDDFEVVGAANDGDEILGGDLWEAAIEVQLPPNHNTDVDFIPLTDSDIHAKVVDDSATAQTFYSNLEQFLLQFGFLKKPPVPVSDRSLDAILEDGGVWDLSFAERERLDQFWKRDAKQKLHETQIGEFTRLRDRHAELLKISQAERNATRRQLLQQVDIVGCTTTGAAKLGSLLESLAPRVMLVEEAGQVLEAHVLGSLVPSIEHMILIGDPLQLRPTLNNYFLSMDSRKGKQLFRFDMSLMERLSSSGLHMSQINVQRRMRPEVSNLIRSTLYPRLIDHAVVKNYPDVRGLQKNVFFLDHTHKEAGYDDDSVSKHNVYEVDMIRDLVIYLLRQGDYSQDGDIVVLCAYLGQLAKIRDKLGKEVAVVIDDRDQQDLADHEADKEDSNILGPRVEHVTVSRRVRLRTVDNYQGEEARIVILSLVRNAGSSGESGQGKIGFLRSENRANVALSRAKEGLYIFGNAPQLEARSPMWKRVIEELQETECIGSALPIACHQHPKTVEWISEPGALQKFAPDGGCLRPCDSRLKCGHVCPYKCHADDPQHVGVACSQRCRRLCNRNHPCSKVCSAECGQCSFPMRHIELPCGHTAERITCYEYDHLSEVSCQEVVQKQLPGCEHSAYMLCSQDPSTVSCLAPCTRPMSCCGRSCPSQCGQCQTLNTQPEDQHSKNPRTLHQPHRCQKSLYCAHLCNAICTQDHKCVTSCKNPCRQECSHSQCKQSCSKPCSPCQKPCEWSCPHFQCPVPCGSVCVRLPCDRRCLGLLSCGHQCPSVCGEDCSIQTCPHCANADEQSRVVDFILQSTLADIATIRDPNGLDELLITLPKCLHTFTIETLDGVCQMGKYYEQDSNSIWKSLRSPSSSPIQPPLCPTCRAPITSPRYGRIFKSADLDILEKNIITHMTESLTIVRQKLDSGALSADTLERTLVEAASKVSTTNIEPAPDKKRAAMTRARKSVLAAKNELPISVQAINPANPSLYYLSPETTKRWEQITSGLVNLYKHTFKMASTRSAHFVAWQAAFSVVYNDEMNEILANPSNAPKRPEEFALRQARMKVGQLEPRADKRFLVETFWDSISIRFLLVRLVKVWVTNLRELINNGQQVVPDHQIQMWGSYAACLLDGCWRDAHIAYGIAQSSDSRKQMTSTVIQVMRADLERFLLTIHMSKTLGKYSDAREDLVQKATDLRETAAVLRIRTSADHLSSMPRDALWLTENFNTKARAITDEWEKLERSLRMDTFYEDVSLEEKTAIIRAFHFSHTGHWYTCSNGHVFVITECGGAMERARCPECGAPIGGSSHTLDSTNSRATDMENISRQQGAAGSPWAWGAP